MTAPTLAETCAILRDAIRGVSVVTLTTENMLRVLLDAAERTAQAEAERDAARRVALTLDDSLEDERQEIARLRAATEWRDSDELTPEDEDIGAAHPLKSGRHDLYQEAMRLVGVRRSKGSLVALVTWLLLRDARLRAERDALLPVVDAARQLSAHSDIETVRALDAAVAAYEASHVGVVEP